MRQEVTWDKQLQMKVPCGRGGRKESSRMRLCVSDMPQLSDQAHKAEQSSSILWVPKRTWPGQVCAPRDRWRGQDN